MGIWAGANEEDGENDWGKEVLAAREKMDRNDLADKTSVTQLALANSVQ